MLHMLRIRSRAATTIQSTWRGWVQRRKWRPVWEGHVEQKQRLQAATVLQQVRVQPVKCAYPASGVLHCVSYAWHHAASNSRIQQRAHIWPSFTIFCVVQAWRCRQARMELSQLKAAVPRKRARKAWLRMLKVAQQAAWQQRLRDTQRQEAVLAIQSAYRGWQVRRVTAKQLAGVRRFQVRHQCCPTATASQASSE